MKKKKTKSEIRFEFGKNWKSFLLKLDNKRINEAERSILEMLEIKSLKDISFLDIGSGSGLFSLAAHKLGASVHSFDYDLNSVLCTEELQSRYFPNTQNWTIEQGSVLDINYLNSLGTFDIVYSWGVLHHTGNLWKALENVIPLVKGNGILFISLYNDVGKRRSQFWWKVKKMYCSGIIGKYFICSIFIPYRALKVLIKSIIEKENLFRYKESRGMSITHDWFDWLGGFPYEVSKVDEIFHFYKNYGFSLKNIKTTVGVGCNEYVFIKKI